MSLTPSQRPTREWPLLIFTVAIVGLVCFPLWQQYAGLDAALARRMDRANAGPRCCSGPEQIACYVCFLWGVLIFLSRFLEVRRQRRAFRLGFLPVEEGARILPEDARPLQRKVDQLVATHGPFILANMVRQALSKFAVSRSSRRRQRRRSRRRPRSTRAGSSRACRRCTTSPGRSRRSASSAPSAAWRAA